MKRPRSSIAAFSLIEILVALGLISFAMIALIGLFCIGLKTGKESSDQIQAANLASLLTATRRGIPTNVIPNFALPPLTGNAADTVTVGINGRRIASDGGRGAAAFKLKYKIAPSAISPNVANVYLLLWWPSSAPVPSIGSPGAYYELTTQIPLP